MKILIMTVGLEIKPLIKSIEYYKPDKICFIHSIDSKIRTLEIIEKTSFSKNNVLYEIINNPQSLLSVYKSSVSAISKAKTITNNIIVDFTVGTSPMRAGLVAAALNEGCTLNYVGTENQNGRKDDGLGIVKDGYESHMKQTDPYDFFAISEEDRGIKFFNKYHFYAAIENFNEALKKTGDENHKNKFKIYKKLSQIYNSWDKFVEDNNGSLYLHLENVQEEIRSYSNNSIMTFDFLDKLNENLIFLKSKLKEKTSNQIDYYVIDLINNAERRLKEGKYDDAIARLYRAIELIAQLNFANLGLMDEKKINDNKEFEYDLNAFERKYNSYKFEEITTKFGKFRKSGTVKNIYTPGLKGTYDLLKLLNQRLGLEFSKKYYNKEKNEELSIFESTLKARNKSILAHGLQPVDKETVKILLNDTIFFGKIIIRNFDKKKRMGEFIKLAYTFGSVF